MSKQMVHVLVYNQIFSSCDPKSVQNLCGTAFKNKKWCYSLINAEVQYPELINLRALKHLKRESYYLSIIFNHDVAIVTVSNSQNESSDTISSTWTSKQINGCIISKQERNSLWVLWKYRVIQSKWGNMVKACIKAMKTVTDIRVKR